jgi:hypothetical protein
MHQTLVSWKRALVMGAAFTFAIASPSLAHTPPGSNGLTPGSEIAPPSFPPQFSREIISIFQALRSGNPTQQTIANILLSTGRLYRYNETIGKLRTVVSQVAVPSNEPGVEQESPGFVRLSLEGESTIPSKIATRFTRYVDTLGNQNGSFRIFGTDRQGVTRDLRVEILSKSEGRIELRFTSTSPALKDATGKPITETILAPNSKVAAVLAGVLSALDIANASPLTLQAAKSMVLSLGNTSLTSAEILQLSQGLSETLIASEAAFGGCGEASALACTGFNMNALRGAIQSYNKVVNETNGAALLVLSQNPEFQTLGDILRRIRATLATRG